uniref:Uncharacterized protein n=1 Tax=Ananas comosus var. bracteatus TaxID=296719 RepID=A0A6V7Q3I8_ANACO|nr:unnamed protein product [Ananas comosus var. bracteatus]
MAGDRELWSGVDHLQSPYVAGSFEGQSEEFFQIQTRLIGSYIFCTSGLTRIGQGKVLSHADPVTDSTPTHAKSLLLGPGTMDAAGVEFTVAPNKPVLPCGPLADSAGPELPTGPFANPVAGIERPTRPSTKFTGSTSESLVLLDPKAANPPPTTKPSGMLDLDYTHHSASIPNVEQPSVDLDLNLGILPRPLSLPRLTTEKLLKYRRSLRLAAKNKGSRKSSLQNAQALMQPTPLLLHLPSRRTNLLFKKPPVSNGQYPPNCRLGRLVSRYQERLCASLTSEEIQLIKIVCGISDADGGEPSSRDYAAGNIRAITTGRS